MIALGRALLVPQDAVFWLMTAIGQPVAVIAVMTPATAIDRAMEVDKSGMPGATCSGCEVGCSGERCARAMLARRLAEPTRPHFRWGLYWSLTEDRISFVVAPWPVINAPGGNA